MFEFVDNTTHEDHVRRKITSSSQRTGLSSQIQEFQTTQFEFELGTICM
jgi:hypothetical protein